MDLLGQQLQFIQGKCLYFMKINITPLIDVRYQKIELQLNNKLQSYNFQILLLD